MKPPLVDRIQAAKRHAFTKKAEMIIARTRMFWMIAGTECPQLEVNNRLEAMNVLPFWYVMST